MPAALPHVTICLRPPRRHAVLPVRTAVRRACPAVLHQPQVAYSAHHTTAGFLDAEARAQTGPSEVAIRRFIAPYRTLFPYGASYQHDQMHLRTELRPEQRRCEPRNADAHLAYIGAGLVACLQTEPDEPLALVDMDGVNKETGRHRTRRVTAVGFTEAHTVAGFEVTIPAPPHSVGATSLRDPRLGVIARIHAALAEHAVHLGCVQLALTDDTDNAALVVNEYEKQLMRYDMAQVLRAPRYFQSKERVPAPASPTVEHHGTGVPAAEEPALRLHDTVRLLVRPPADNGASRLVQGRYQSPIVLHRTPRERTIRVTVMRYR
ncbi:hypothetical protein CRI93_11880 [Longimonas halophila]|uniref:Uncharacterized protein n=1 Tax=Longimonas halophila TaxID=1469170 RepID=A0A2H3P3C9_9BACT|nr:hypothetical protein [Longimonas halophila]PEN05795.1 hypothetical protein CRI93_11880 [Longimonas halophila]